MKKHKHDTFSELPAHLPPVSVVAAWAGQPIADRTRVAASARPSSRQPVQDHDDTPPDYLDGIILGKDSESDSPLVDPILSPQADTTSTTASSPPTTFSPGLRDNLFDDHPLPPSALQHGASLAGLTALVALGSGKHHGGISPPRAPLARAPEDSPRATPDPAPDDEPAPSPVPSSAPASPPDATAPIPPSSAEPPPLEATPAPLPAPQPAPEPAPAPSSKPEPGPAPVPSPEPAPPSPPPPPPLPPPPDYGGSRRATKVAHDERVRIDPEWLAGRSPEHAPAHIRILGIEALGHDDSAASPLQLVRPGQAPETIVRHQIIQAADFEYLHWQAAGNDGGHFSFEALDANRVALPDVPIQQVHIEEHPTPPRYPKSSAPYLVAHDDMVALSSLSFTGLDRDTAPPAIRITQLNPEDSDGTTPALILLSDDGSARALSVGDEITQADFGRLRWQAGGNSGGSFDFVPLTARGEIILGATPQRISVHESPLPPEYHGSTGQAVAHDQVLGIDTALLTGTSPARAPAHVRIEAITPAGTVAPDAPALFLLDRDGQRIPVQPGQVLNAEQYGRLHWDSDVNAGGQFRFQALDEAGHAIQGSEPRTITIIEDPLPPVYPAAPEALAVAHDATLNIDPLRFTGTDISRKPDFIRITAIDESGSAGQTPSALQQTLPAQNGEPPATVSLTVDSIVPFAAFRLISWNASTNGGGSFSFVPSTGDGRALEGATEQRIRIHESPLAPDYAKAPLLKVAHDQVLALPASVFAGDDPARKPAKVRITHIHEHENQLDHKSPLFFLSGPGDSINNRVHLKEGKEIPASIYDRIQWDSQVNSGGHFTIIALDAQGIPIEGSQPRTITVHESPLPPHYSPHHTPTPVGHNGETAFALSQLRGVVSSSDGRPSPSTGYIRITAIDETDDTDPQASPLFLKPATPGGETTRIGVGNEIAVADLDRLRWHAEHNEGGSFRFRPLDSAGHEIVGASEQHIEVYESPIPPSYPVSYQHSVTAAHDSITTLDARLFAGDTPHTAPAFIRIESVSETQDTPGGAGPALMLNRGQHGERELRTGSIVAFAEFSQLSWDTTHNDGGRFSFRSLDQNQRNIVGSRTVQVAIQESPPLPPVYGYYSVNLSVGHDQVHHFDAALFQGSDPQRAPSAVWIEVLNETNDTAPNQPALMIDRGLPTARPLTLVKGSMVLSAADFSKLSWDASSNEGGHFTFHPLDKHNQLMGHGQVLTVNVQEHPAVPSYPSTQPRQLAGHDSELKLDRALFEGSANAPAYLKIEAIDAHGTSTLPASGVGALKIDHDGQASTPLQAVALNTPIARADFDKLYWDASSNTGGSFSFVPTLADGTPILGAQSQMITVRESPPVPTVHASLDKRLPHDQEGSYFKTHLFGSKNPAPHVRIEAIQETSDTAPNTSPLRLQKTDGSSTEVNDNDIIDADGYQALHWSAADNTGGSFRVVFLDEHHQEIVGASPRTATITESPPPPAYSAPKVMLTVPHEGTLQFSPHLFTGSDPTKQPAYIRIDSIQSGLEGSDQQVPNGAASGLRLDQGSGSQKIYLNGSAVNNGGPIILSIGDVGKLSWNAADNAGGQIQFTALDANQAPILGATRPTLVFNEEAAPAHIPAPPPAQSTPEAPVAGHNRTTFLDKSVFIGEAPGATTAGRFFKITNIHDYEHAEARDINEMRKLNWHNNIPNREPTAYEVVRVPGGLTKAQAMARAQEANGKLLELGESAWYTDHSNQPENVWIGNWLGSLTDRQGSSLNLSIDKVHHAGSAEGRLEAFVIEYQNYHHPLKLHKADDPSTAETIWEGQIVGEDDLERISWNTAQNNGGSIRFTEVMGRVVNDGTSNTDLPGNTPRPGTSPRTVHILELSSDGITVTPKGPQAIRQPALKLQDLLKRDDSIADTPENCSSRSASGPSPADCSTPSAGDNGLNSPATDPLTHWKGVDLATLLDERF